MEALGVTLRLAQATANSIASEINTATFDARGVIVGERSSSNVGGLHIFAMRAHPVTMQA